MRHKKMFEKIIAMSLTLLFCIGATSVAYSSELKIKPKTQKTIKIGVMDWLSSIEVAAFVNGLYKKEAKKRGWDIQIFDLKGNNGESIQVMENMISAGFDAIVVNWVSPRFYEKQVQQAYQKGIPIITNAGGHVVKGQVAEFTACLFSEGAEPANYIANKCKPGDSVILFYGPQIGTNVLRFEGAMSVFKYYKMKTIIQAFQGKSDPSMEAYSQVKNALLADTQKKIKAVWAAWEGFGVAAARAAHEIGRDDVIVATIDDSPRTLATMRKLPTLKATASLLGNMPRIVEMIYEEFDKVFKGNKVETEQVRFCSYYFVTKENMPPVGYFYRTDGEYSGEPDYVTK